MVMSGASYSEIVMVKVLVFRFSHILIIVFFNEFQYLYELKKIVIMCYNTLN